jgi:hypothetical protein
MAKDIRLSGSRVHPAIRFLSATPSKKLHSDEGLVAVPADFVDRANVGMIECRCGRGFTSETLQCLRVLRHIVGQELQGDETTEPGILGLEDDTHPAAAQLLDDSVVRDGLADHGEQNPEARSLLCVLRPASQ